LFDGPVVMTTLAVIFGLLPAAPASRIVYQTQKPLAIVVTFSSRETDPTVRLP
jgi:multidrug efflux pump subunit AcrB